MKIELKKLSIEVFGESHSDKIGLRLNGLPLDTVIDENSVAVMLNRRRSGRNAWSTPRSEADEAVFTSGVKDGKADGAEIVAEIKNTDMKPQAYEVISTTPRPSHADYVAYVKDGKIPSGGGRFSGRMTAPLCIGGAIAEDLLKTFGISVCAYVSEIGKEKSESYLDGSVSLEEAESAKAKLLPILGAEADEKRLVSEVLTAREDGDSVGGVIECLVFGAPVGLGETMFDGLEGSISKMVFAVPAVKGVEFGGGFELSRMRGSEANDAFRIVGNKVQTATNNSGGINGGISNGMPICLRVAIKPTPSIAKEQNTVDLKTLQNTTIKIGGRHDACIVPRAVAAVESAVALAILDEML